MYRHGVIDPSGRVVNVIIWDGESPWNPPLNHIAVQHDYIDIDDIWNHNDKVLIKKDRINKETGLIT